MKYLPKEVWILALCQFFFTAAIAVDLTITSLAGQSLAGSPELATLPFALLTVGGALVMPIFARFIRVHGRRYVLIAGSIMGVVGALISTASVWNKQFWGLCVGCALVGAFQASAQFYRLAAGDLVANELKQRAVSLALTGGVIAAFLGPTLAAWAAFFFPSALYTGSYLVVCGLTLLSTVMLVVGYKVDGKIESPFASITSRARTFIALKKPLYFVATINGVLSTSIMMFIMSSAPLAIIQNGWSMEDSASVMQWHLVGMYAPSLLAGYIFQKLGAGLSLIAGLGLSFLAVLVGLHAGQLSSFYWALGLLGVGWNISFVTSSILMSQGTDPDLRRSAQSASETLRYFFSSITTLVAAAALEFSGWYGLNIATLPFLLIGFIITIWWMYSSKT